MASAKTWIWIIVGVVGVCLLSLFAVAGAGVYFVSQHINAERTSSADAVRAFDAARGTFQGAIPLLELDGFERVHAVRPLGDLPTAGTKPDALWVLAWNPDRERLVKVSVPFWILRLGRKKIDVATGESSFAIDRLNLDVPELERIGPALVLDYRMPNGERVLVWTR
jgi:hypothetical protein